jgi:3-hydroxy-3-methylglutaryl CoA synthase
MCAALNIYSSHDSSSFELKPLDTTHTRSEMDEQDHDDRYSEPCYFDAEQGIWINAHYEPIELPSTRYKKICYHGFKTTVQKPGFGNIRSMLQHSVF